MFAKLLKYEWRSSAPLFGILSGAVLLLAVLGGFLLRQIVDLGLGLSGTVIFTGTTSLFFIVLSLLGYTAAINVILLIRFYKHKFTDEGYLTFTLPVTVDQIFLSSALNMLIWHLIALIVVLLCAVVMVFIGTSGLSKEDLQGVIDSVGLDFSVTSVDWLGTLASAVNAVYSVILPMTCLTLGAVKARKHKILSAFGFYYLILIGMGILESFLNTAAYLSSLMDPEDVYQQLTVEATIIPMIVQVVIIVGGYFLSTHLMRRKLNLN